MFGFKKSQADEATVEQCASALYEALAKVLTQKGRIRAEDLISAAAAIVGEMSIEAAGDMNPRDHTFSPGQRVLSTKANILFSGDKDLNEAPADSIVGIFQSKLLSCGFVREDFPPSLKEIFTYFTANVGKAEDWGKVPLSVPAENHPFIMPLRVAYESRGMIDKLFAPLGNNHQQRLRAATLTLAKTVCETCDVLNRRIAITLALETVNGMSKTAPMTDAALAKAQQKV
jgi:hypothetical protein